MSGIIYIEMTYLQKLAMNSCATYNTGTLIHILEEKLWIRVEYKTTWFNQHSLHKEPFPVVVNKLNSSLILFLKYEKNKVNRTTEAQIFHSSSHHKRLPDQILGDKTVKNIQIDQQTTEIWPKELFVTLSVSEWDPS